MGTHTSNQEPNYLLIMKARIPNVDSISSDTKDNTAISAYYKVENKIEIETRINHEGEVNKARVMPQKFNIIATKTPSGQVHIFDYYKHPLKPTDTISKPQIRLLGHIKEGYGLNWSAKREGYLISGSDDHKVCLWDINNCSSNSLNPLRTLDEHKGIVEDVNWHKHNENMFASCGDDRKLIVWDLKQINPIFNIEAHSQEINSVDFNPFNEFHLITASNDSSIALWDIRNLSKKIHSFNHHNGDVMAARWNPNIESIFASYSSDRRINVWDLNKIGNQQSVEDEEDGPVELLVIFILILVYSWWPYC
jgi:histone-binding protein RBBP4